MLTLPMIIDSTVAALLRYFTCPIDDEAPVPVREPYLPSGVVFPKNNVLVLAARAPMMLGSDVLTDIASRYASDVLFVRLREDNAVTIDLALRHLHGVEILRAMRPAVYDDVLYLAGANQDIWASLTAGGPRLTLRRPWRTTVHEAAARAAAASEIAAVIAAAGKR